jgi:hypothetical protein
MKAKHFCRDLGAIALLCLVAHSAHATVIEIPLPGLLGNYPVSGSNDERTTTFQLPQTPTLIHGVSFRIAGTAVVGSVDCDEYGDNAPWPMDFLAEMQDATSNWWLASPHPYVRPDGAFGWTASFHSSDGATWGFLLDGEGEIILFGGPGGLIADCHQPWVIPSGSVTEAVLIIDAEFPVATEPSTWGRVKALYR